MSTVESDCGLIVLLELVRSEIFRRCRSRVTDLKSEFLQMFQRLMMMVVMVVVVVMVMEVMVVIKMLTIRMT